MISTIPRATTSAQDLSATLGYVVYDSTKTLLSWLKNDGVTKVYAGTDKSHDYRYGMLVGAVCKNHTALAPNLSATCSSVDPRTGPTLTFNWYDHDPLCAGYSRIAFGISDDLDYAASRHLGGSSGLVSVGGGYNVSMPSCAYNGASLYDTVQYLLWER